MHLQYRHQVVQALLSTGLVPTFYHPDVQVAREVMLACYRGGIRTFEFTNRGDFAHEVFGELSRFAHKELPDLALGIGTIHDAGTAALYLQLGARFVVSPVLVPEVAKVCHRRKVLWVPGCGTASEISQAEELGAEIIKLFPADAVGGPGFVKALLGPQPWTLILASGGVKPEEGSLRSWFEAGVACAGLGSQLFPAEMIEAGKFDEITALVAGSVAAARRYSRFVG